MSKGMSTQRYLAAMVVLVAFSSALPAGSSCAEPVATVHGSLDAYAGHGIALAWGVLRDRDETRSEVVVRVDADPNAYRTLLVVGVDPFTKRSEQLLAPGPIGGTRLARVLRARFADLPRTEWRFYAQASPSADDAPAVLVYYQGVPDTTPEFDDEAKLEASLAARIDRARRTPAPR